MFKRILFLILVTSGFVFSQALDFPGGAASQATTTDQQLNTGAAGWTVDVHFKLDALPGAGLFMCIVTHSTGLTFFTVDENGHIFTGFGGSLQLTSTPISAGTWYQIALIKTGVPGAGQHRLNFYLDGTQVGGNLDRTYTGATQTLRLGVSSANISLLNGKIDELRVTGDPEATGAELAAFVKTEVTNPSSYYTKLAGYYKFASNMNDEMDMQSGTLGTGVTYASDPLPVELTAFNASVIDNGIELKWETATEVNNYGFEVQRSAYSGQRSEFESVGFVDGAGNSNSPRVYSFVDDNPLTGTVQYRLKQVDIDGSYEYSDAVEISFTNSPTEFTLDQNYPNPFNPSTVISYQLPVTSDVQLRIFDVLGSEIATLVNEFKEAGNYEVRFDGSNLPSGMYFYTMNIGEQTFTKKMLILK